MGFFRKMMLGFLSSFLVTLVTLFILNSTFNEVVVNGIFSEGLKTFLTDNQSNFFPEQGGESAISEGVINNMMNSEEMQVMINEFSKVIIEKMGNGNSEEASQYDFGDKMMEYFNENKEKISEETGVEFTDESINRVTSQIKNGNFNNNMNNMIENSKKVLSPEQQQVFNTISSFTTASTKNMIFTVIIVDIILIIIFSWSFYKWLSPIGKGFIIGSAFPIGIAYIVKKIILSTLNITVNISPILDLSYRFILLGIILIIIYVIINMFIKKKETVDDVVPRITNTSA